MRYHALLKENELLKSVLVDVEEENLGLKIYYSKRL